MLKIGDKHDKKSTAQGVMYIVTLLLSVWIFSCGNIDILAAPKDATPSKANYVDSIRHDNIVYTEHEISNLVNYLNALKHTSTPDSLRQYATEGMLNFSWYLINKGEWFLCGKLLQTAQRYCPPSATLFSHQIMSAVAGIALYNKDYDEAGRLLLKTNQYFQQTADTAEWLKSCVNLGLYYSRVHNRPKALEYYMKVLSIAQKEKQYESYYSIVSGYAERIEEDSIIGLSTLEKALRISVDNGYTFLLPSNYNELARYYYRMDNYHEAIANARKALNYSERLSQNDMQIRAYGTLADIYYIQKNYVAAYEMLAKKISIKDKCQEKSGITYYAHLSAADSLISWVNANVPLPGNGSKIADSNPNGNSNNWIMWVIFGVIAMTLVGLLIVKRVKQVPIEDTKEILPENLPKDETIVPLNPEASVQENNAMLQQAAALNMVAESFNPMLDRIRNMVKEIPKSGDSNVDSQVRSLMNYLLQTRLPESDNTLAQTVKAEEMKFTQRLSSSYPALTKNDIRMALYIRSGLNLQEISAISGLQAKSVNQARYRLRKSLGLGQEDSLESFILTF